MGVEFYKYLPSKIKKLDFVLEKVKLALLIIIYTKSYILAME